MTYAAFVLPAAAAPRRPRHLPILNPIKRWCAERRKARVRLREMIEEAIEPTTSPERLEAIVDEAWGLTCRFWRWRFPEMLGRALAVHPNMPTKQLGWLIGQGFLDAVCRNPILPLLPLSDEAASVFETWDCSGILAMREPPLALLYLLVQSERLEIAEGARFHVSLSGEILLDDWRTEVMRLLQRLVDEARSYEWEHVLEMHDLGMLPRWLALDTLPTEERGAVSFALHRPKWRDDALPGRAQFIRWLKDPATPSEPLTEFAKVTCDGSMVEALAHRKGASRELLQVLYRRSDVWNMRWLIEDLVVHPNADSEFLDKLVLSGNATLDVRRKARAHPAASPNVLRYCRWCVLRNGQNTRDQFLASQFFADLYPITCPQADDTRHERCWYSRLAAVLGEQITPYPDRLRAFAGDTNRLVRAVAQARLRGEYEPADFFRPDFTRH